ncbi:MAG: Peptidyl-prolyl cis-trans isomerase B [Fimbriimonadaceae bacterium]|nr:Peptidyl-prolyl cis-trans isomerase B [Fimbriimonadaceae bacterium]
MLWISVLAAVAPGLLADSVWKVTLEGGKSFEITTDSKGSPKTAAHFDALVKKKFYNGQRIHRVDPDFVVQWGAPQSRTMSLDSPEVGSGGSGKNVVFEASQTSFKRGVVGVASTGARVGGDSQLFIMLSDKTHLDGSYAVLGRVTKGMDVVSKIKRGDKIVSITILKGKS